MSTSNGRRDTHVMAHEFQQHPTGIIEKGSAEPGVITLVISRLMKTVACSRSSSRYVQLEHYSGPKKVNPPFIAMTSGIPYMYVCAREESREVAEQNDTVVELPFIGRQHGVVWLQHPACQKTNTK